MSVALFTMRDIEETWANFDLGAGRRRARGASKVPATAATAAAVPKASGKYRPTAAATVNPFSPPSPTVISRDAARANPTFFRRTRRGGLAIVKKGQRKAGRAIQKAISPGVRAGGGNIATGIRQIAGDAGLATRKAGRGVLSNIGQYKGRYALGALGVAAAGGGAAYLMNRDSAAYSRSRSNRYSTFNGR